MYRIWLWPLVITGIGIASWAIVKYSLPMWLFIIVLILFYDAVKLDLRLSDSNQRQTDTVLRNVSGQGDFGLSRISQIIIGIVALLFALVMFAWASTAPGNPYFNILPGLFFVIVSGACLLPRRYRGYCGDLISVLILGIAIWFLVTASWAKPGSNLPVFALVYGGLSIAYLVKRYARYFSNRKT